MIQLMFDDSFDKIIEKPINYWKTMNDVPPHIINYIKNTSDSIPLYDSKTEKYYCPKCLNELDNTNNCFKCIKKYVINPKKVLLVQNIKKIKDYRFDKSYYIFDIRDNNVIIYILNEQISYNNPLSLIPFKMSEVTIDSIYHVLSDRIVDLKTNQCFYYKDLEKILKGINEIDDNIDNDLFGYDIYEIFKLSPTDATYLYTENLEELKKTELYKYSNIWNLKSYLTQNNFNLATLTYNPIYCKQFEYLIKMKLYNLACNSSTLIEYNRDFKNTFGIDKKYYQFMVDNDISYWNLKALRLCPTTDLELLNFVSEELYLSEEISKYVKLDKLKVYFEKQGLNIKNLNEYYDYIRCCEKMKLDLKDNDILFPKYFTKQHDKVTSEMIIANDPKTNENIRNLSTMLNLNRYEDDKYIIFPADSIESLVDESSQQSNCVRTYCELVSSYECQIYFMRYKNDINKSLVTIEVRNGKIVQAKTKFNEEPTQEILNILKKWETNLIPIINT